MCWHGQEPATTAIAYMLGSKSPRARAAAVCLVREALSRTAVGPGSPFIIYTRVRVADSNIATVLADILVLRLTAAEGGRLLTPGVLAVTVAIMLEGRSPNRRIIQLPMQPTP